MFAVHLVYIIIFVIRISCAPHLANLSMLSPNCSGASGGAIHHAGALDVFDTRFAANKAGVRGMAVTSLGVFNFAANTSFENNARYCPLNQYSYDEDLVKVT